MVYQSTTNKQEISSIANKSEGELLEGFLLRGGITQRLPSSRRDYSKASPLALVLLLFTMNLFGQGSGSGASYTPGATFVETNTFISGPAGNQVYVNEAGTNFPIQIDDADADPLNEIQDISTNGAAGNITISSGSTLNLNVNDADSDPTNELQTISKVGNTITLSGGGGSVTDDVNDADSDPTNELQTLTLTTEDIIVGFASGYQDVATTVQARNCTITRTAPGRYTVTFTTPHPDGTDYEVVFGTQESAATRDVPKVSVVDGSRTANSFQVQHTVDDNGGTADVYTNEPWSFQVLRTVTVLTNVTISP